MSDIENKNFKKFYKFVLYKLSGHETWRIVQGTNPVPLKDTKVTEQKIILINRFTGEIEEQKTIYAK